MLKIDRDTLEHLEEQSPGIRDSIRVLEARSLPSCPRCGSEDTASVACGVVGRTMALAAVATRFKLVANGPTPGNYFGNACGDFFD